MPQNVHFAIKELILVDNGAVQAEHQSKSKCRVCSSGKFLYDFYDLSGPFHVKSLEKFAFIKSNFDLSITEFTPIKMKR